MGTEKGNALCWVRVIARLLLLLLLSRFSRVRLCDPVDGSPLGSSVPGILQARILEWVAISFSNTCMHTKLLQLYPTLIYIMLLIFSFFSPYVYYLIEPINNPLM